METKVIAIAAVDENWAAGSKGHLLFDNAKDLKRFSDLTRNHTVVMGRKTLESLPESSPLPNRCNVVMSEDVNFIPHGCTVLHTIDELRHYIDTSNDEVVWIIGGEEIWRSCLPFIDECQITSHYESSENADTFFPNLDQLKEWTIASIDGPHTTEDDIQFEYRTYRKLK